MNRSGIRQCVDDLVGILDGYLKIDLDYQLICASFNLLTRYTIQSGKIFMTQPYFQPHLYH